MVFKVHLQMSLNNFLSAHTQCHSSPWQPLIVSFLLPKSSSSCTLLVSHLSSLSSPSSIVVIVIEIVCRGHLSFVAVVTYATLFRGKNTLKPFLRFHVLRLLVKRLLQHSKALFHSMLLCNIIS